MFAGALEDICAEFDFPSAYETMESQQIARFESTFRTHGSFTLIKPMRY